MRFRTFVAAAAIAAVLPTSTAAFQVPFLLGPASVAADVTADQAVPRQPTQPPPAPAAPVPRPVRLIPQRYPYPPPYPIPRRPRPELTECERTAMFVFLTLVGGALILRATK